MHSLSRAASVVVAALALTGCNDGVSNSAASHSPTTNTYCTAYATFMTNTADLVTDRSVMRQVTNQAIENANKAAAAAPDAKAKAAWKRAAGDYEATLRDDATLQAGLSIDAQNDVATTAALAGSYCKGA